MRCQLLFAVTVWQAVGLLREVIERPVSCCVLQRVVHILPEVILHVCEPRHHEGRTPKERRCPIVPHNVWLSPVPDQKKIQVTVSYPAEVELVTLSDKVEARSIVPHKTREYFHQVTHFLSVQLESTGEFIQIGKYGLNAVQRKLRFESVEPENQTQFFSRRNMVADRMINGLIIFHA